MKNYYMLSNGRLKREGHSLTIEDAEGKKKPIPVEDVDSLYVYGEVDLNSKLLNFLAQKRIPLHVFNYYGFYSGSYYPREYLNSGFLLVNQVQHYSEGEKRLRLARELVRASAHSIGRNVAYYSRRKNSLDNDPPGEIDPEAPPPSAIPTDDALETSVDSYVQMPSPTTEEADAQEADPFAAEIDFEAEIPSLEQLRRVIAGLALQIEAQQEVNGVRGIEGKMRERYYHCWRHILSEGWVFHRRVRRPPDNEVNALISFGNSILYTVCLSELYRTQLTPTISYLHEPGARRFSLALDLSEIFKPLIVDRAIFRLINTSQLQDSHFERSLGSCYLNDEGKKLFLKALEERLGSTIYHRRLKRHVSYRHLIRLECYKLIRHLSDLEPYKAFRAWW